MIPLPTAADDHQRKNAEAMQNAGAAKMILQDQIYGETSLAEALKRLAGAPDDYRRNGSWLQKNLLARTRLRRRRYY